MSSEGRVTVIASEFGREFVPGYVAWREHHKLCWHCGRYDWFEPGRPAMRLTPPVTATDRILWPYQRTLPDGKTSCWFVECGDSNVLCGIGRRLYHCWVRHAVGGSVW